MSTPELVPVEFDPEFQARIAATQKRRADDHQAGMDGVLADALAVARRIAAKEGMSSDPSVYGNHCVNCEERWCLPADKASCAHKPICEDCWPNGCPDCEREVEEGLRRREAAAARILTAALELRTGADDLSETDMGLLDWRARKDILRHVELTTEALRRVHDVLSAQVQIMSEPLSITRTAWYRLQAPAPKPEIWDLTVGNGQHLGWDRCWAFVNSHVLGSREISIVWSIAYAMKDACERLADKQAAAAYEQGWRDACDDHLDQQKYPDHPIGERKGWPKP